MGKIPVIDLSYQWQSVKTESLSVLEEVLNQGQYILGNHVAALEQEVAEYTGNRYGVGVGNGTDALTLALHGLGVGAGDEVITTPFTFFATAEAIAAVGAIPVFADIDPKTFVITAETVKEKISSKTKAILPVHIFGLMADMKSLQELARADGLKLVEDACQAIGAKQDSRGIGVYSDAAAVSFFPTKNLGSYGDGGMVLMEDEELAARIKRLRVHGSTQKYRHAELGWNSRLDEIQAALLRIKLRKLDEWTKQRQTLAARYQEALNQVPIQLPSSPRDTEHVYHLYTILAQDRDGLKQHLSNQQIGSSVYYPLPLHLQPALAGLGYQKGALPAAEDVSEHCLSLPLYPGMEEQQQDEVIKAVKAYFAGA
ncbi:DegT/DnrJ/EryC1/StrS family aminotransferase [Alicyclobacillus sp. SO9]|nr:DegT/DnrJ/EryC1/StrS family aminotransferase [Alicyclobacillus sp. SO9]